jgi:DNA segregation ATPase FtsK/SpoIIIE-like protein
MDYHAKLGRALDHLDSPLVTPPDRTGRRFAVWPTFANGLLLVGATGNGKSTQLRFMVTDLIRTPGSKALFLADGKFSGAFLMFRDVPGVAEIAGTPEAIGFMVRGYFAEVEERYERLSEAREQALKTRGRPRYQTPGPLYLILDEYLNWVLALPERERKEVISKLVRIGSIGREVNCRLVIATQRPGTKEVDTGLPGLLKAQLKCRVAASGLLGLDSIETRMAFDDDSYSHRMPSRLGAGFVKVGRHEVKFVVPWLADPTDPDTSDADRQAAWKLLHPTGVAS